MGFPFSPIDELRCDTYQQSIMLLKVDIYPCSGQAYTGETREPAETLHVCLATSRSSLHGNTDDGGTDDRESVRKDRGRLLTVGRKVGDVLLRNDKTVSREHLIVRLVTTNKAFPTSSSGRSTALPELARTAEEQQACQQSSSFYQCAVVLESVGKLGSLIIEETTATKKSVTNPDDSDTDDEGDAVLISQPGMAMAASQGQQVVLPSWIQNLVVGSEEASKKSLSTRAVNQSTILTPLNTDHGRIVVLCGKQDSILVLTRVPLYVQRTRSSFPTNAVPSWWSELYATGAVEVSDGGKISNVLHPQTTHLILSERKTTHLQLCAWLKGIHIVKADYFQALLERKSMHDPLPRLDSYVPPCPSGHNFWESPPKLNVWNGLLYISMKRGDEWPDVVEAMGGTVCRLYQEIENQSDSDDNADDRDEDEMSQQRLSQFDPACTWSVDLKSRRYSQPLKQANIPLFSSKDVAKAVTSGKMLPGMTPNTTATTRLETQSTKTRSTAKGRNGSTHSTPAQSKSAASAESNKSPTSETEAIEKASNTSRPSSMRTTSHPETQATLALPQEDKTKSSPARRTRSSRKAMSSSDSDSDVEPRKGRRRPPRRLTPQSRQKSDKAESHQGSIDRKSEKEAETSRVELTESADEKGIQEERSKIEITPKGNKENEETIRSIPEQNSSQSKARESEATADSISEERTSKRINLGESKATADSIAEERTAKRIKLGTYPSMNGWLQAAPSGKQRRAHVRTKEEILEKYQGEHADTLYTTSASTEWTPKLIQENTQPDVEQSTTRRRRDTSGPNFKGFRKNRIPPLQKKDYQWKSHLSVPAVQKAQFEEEQRTADEQFRRANELFKDVSGPFATGRRRNAR